MERRPSASASPRDWWWVFDPRESLRARAALILGGGAIVFTLLIAWIGGTLLRRHLESQLGATFESLAAQVSNTLDRRLYERFRELQFVASLPSLRDPRTDPAERRRVLEALQVSVPDFAWVGVADPSGYIVAATQKQFEKESARELRWFVQAQEHPYAGPLREFPALTGSMPVPDRDPRVLDIAVPIIGMNGEFAGVVASHVRWGWAREAQLAIVPESAKREHLGVTVYSAANEVVLDSGATGWTIPPEPPALPQRRFRGSMLETTAEGSVYLTGYIRSRGHAEFRGLGLLTIVRQPVRRALAPAHELRLAIARWGFLFSGTLLVVSWIFAGRLARRLDAVTAAAGRIQAGDILTVIPQPRGNAEIDHMCGAVGGLVQDLRPKDNPAPEPSSPPPPPSGYVRPTGSDPRRVIW